MHTVRLRILAEVAPTGDGEDMASYETAVGAKAGSRWWWLWCFAKEEEGSHTNGGEDDTSGKRRSLRGTALSMASFNS